MNSALSETKKVDPHPVESTFVVKGKRPRAVLATGASAPDQKLRRSASCMMRGSSALVTLPKLLVTCAPD